MNFPTSLWLLPIGVRLYLIFVTTIIGLVFGSFGNAWAYRLVHGERISHGRSHCPACGHTLGILDLIPLFSYIFLKGRCRYCREPISPRYPISEAVSALIFVSILLKYGIGIQTIFLWGFGFFLMVLSFVDWESMIIPDRLIILGGIAGMMSRIRLDVELGIDTIKPLGIALIEGVIVAGALLAIVLIADRVLKKDTMGGGDIKLVFIIAMTLGLLQGVLALFVSCIIGLIIAVVPGAKGREGEQMGAFPFGPALTIATWLVLLVGDGITDWYRSLLYL